MYRRARELDQLRTMSSKKNPGTLPAEAATEEYERKDGALANFFGGLFVVKVSIDNLFLGSFWGPIWARNREKYMKKVTRGQK